MGITSRQGRWNRESRLITITLRAAMPGVAVLLLGSTSQISPRKGLGADPGSQLVVAKTVVAFQDFQVLKGASIRMISLFFEHPCLVGLRLHQQASQ